MSNILFSASIVSIGKHALDGVADKMLITFGPGAPEDYCQYVVLLDNISSYRHMAYDFNKLQLMFGEDIYRISALGTSAWDNLSNLGHVTLFFDGMTTAKGYGAIHLTPPVMPENVKPETNFVISLCE